MKKRLFIIDGNSFCYRAYYAIRSLSNSKGQATNAVYGVLSMIRKLLSEEKPEYICVAFDLKGPTVRHQKYDKYKAHRKPMPDDLVTQMPIIKEVVRAYKIPIFEIQGVEADDIIGTIARKAEKDGIFTYIVTGDKDALQLVGPGISVYSPHNEKTIFDEEMVKIKFGVTPAQIPDLIAIMGDSSDNIPGITGIGEKGARELLGEFGSLENMLDNVSRIKSESKRKLVETHREDALLSKELAVLNTELPVAMDYEDLKVKEPDMVKLTALFKELEFKTLLKEIMPKDDLESEYILITDKKAFEEFTTELKKQKEIVIDCETTGEDPMISSIVGMSFSWEKGRAYYVPFNSVQDVDHAGVIKVLKPILENAGIRKIGQNIKYDYIVLANTGIYLENIYFDTMVASYVLNPSKLNHNLGDISIELLGHRMTPIEDLIGKGKNSTTMDMVDVKKVSDYSCEDSDVTLRVKEILAKDLEKKDMAKLFFDVEMPLVKVLASLEMTGVKVDVKYLSGLSEEMGEKLDTHRKKIYEMAGDEFNINSPKQLQGILFDKLKMPVVKRTKTGPSTDEEVLTTLSEKYELPKQLLRYRELSKLKSTYVDALPGLINSFTGKVHTSYNQTVTQTGRLSSSEPNLQNIPVKTEEGRKIRRAFIPSEKSGILLSADYSQIELRVLAHMSGDENLLKAFREDKDIHAYTASLIYGVDEKDVTDDMRATAKTVNFGIVYGMGPFKLSKDLGIPMDKAKEFIDNYFRRYSGIKKFLDGTLIEAREKKFVTTILNRRRYIPDISNENMRMRSFAERTAINAPIQGSAADIIKMAMIKISSDMKKFKSRMILQVHDELVFDVRKKELDDLAGIVRSGMEGILKLSVPLSVNIETGPNWLDMETYDT